MKTKTYYHSKSRYNTSSTANRAVILFLIGAALLAVGLELMFN